MDGGAYGGELFRYVLCDMKGRLSGDDGHLFPYKRGEDLPVLVPEKGPDHSERGNDLIGADPLPFRFVGRFFPVWASPPSHSRR
jgi:hypothetical protein